MRTFTDADGVVWRIPPLTTDKIRALREELGLDLLDPNAGWLQPVATDLVKLIALLMAVCVKNTGATSDIDYNGWRGDVFDDALDAFVAALADFSQRRQRLLLTAHWKRAKAAMDEVTANMVQQITPTPGGTTSTTPPDGSASTPAA